MKTKSRTPDHTSQRPRQRSAQGRRDRRLRGSAPRVRAAGARPPQGGGDGRSRRHGRPGGHRAERCESARGPTPGGQRGTWPLTDEKARLAETRSGPRELRVRAGNAGDWTKRKKEGKRKGMGGPQVPGGSGRGGRVPPLLISECTRVPTGAACPAQWGPMRRGAACGAAGHTREPHASTPALRGVVDGAGLVVATSGGCSKGDGGGRARGRPVAAPSASSAVALLRGPSRARASRGPSRTDAAPAPAASARGPGREGFW